MPVQKNKRSPLNRFGNGVLALVLVPFGARSPAATQLPIPCVALTCGTNVKSFVSSGAATAAQSGNTLSVHQTSNNATLNWSSFNISADGKVVFVQPNATSIALNRIFDANPSSLFGSLSANGQIYLINANGFLFGSTARVNVAGLIASSLNISDSTFSTGILAPLQNGLPALEPFVDSTGTAIVNTGTVTVQTGAQLTAAGGGRLLLAAPTVKNTGSLSAPDGQIVLAAGQGVYLQASDDPGLRGLIVEVEGTGSAANRLAGVLSAPRGNVTMVGLAVNQDGRVSATTSVSANGSVTLEAAQGLHVGGTGAISSTQGGTLELGTGSLIDILPEYSDTATAVDAQTQLQSSIKLTGQQVLMHGGSIDAPSGILAVNAAANPSEGVLSGGSAQAEIRIAAGTDIDLAGSDAILPMAANLVTVQLRSNELADDPTQRNGALRGQTVTVDARTDGGAGTPIADVTSAIAAVGKTIAQRTEAGGTATFLSEGDVVFNPGASIDVSGGKTTYLGGTIQTTKLVGANGQLYDIGSANPLQGFTGVVNPTLTQTYDKWGVREIVATPGLSHYESTYDQGAAAGSVQFAAPSLALGGNLKANVITGPYQRGPFGSAFGDAVAGGTLIIGEPTGAGGGASLLTDYLAPSVIIASQLTPVVVADNTPLPPQTLQLPASYLTSDGFTNSQVFSNTTIALPVGLPLQLPAGAALLLSAPRVDVNSDITSVGGTLNFQSVQSTAAPDLNDPVLPPGSPRLGVGVGDGVSLNVSGQWTNDSVLGGGLGSAPILQNGGGITLQLTTPGSELVVGNGVTLRADGGAWLQNSGTVAGGTGGQISIDASPAFSAVQFGQNLVVEAFGSQAASGGRFALSAPRITISQGDSSAWTTAQRVDDLLAPGQALSVFAPLFSNDGFSAVNLTATGAAPSATDSDVLTLSAGTILVAQTRSVQVAPGYQTQLTGAALGGFSTVSTLPDYSRPVASVSLNVLRGTDDLTLGSTGFGGIDVQAGSAILADPGASVSLSSIGSIFFGGTVKSSGGSVNLGITLVADTIDPGYLPAQGITLGATSLIDVSGGAAVLTPNNQGLLLGSVRSGGVIDIDAQRGTVLAQPGSFMSIAGSSATLDIANPGSNGGYIRQATASPAGSLTVGSVEAVALLGAIDARAGVGSAGAAAAGSLEVDLTQPKPVPGQPDPFGAPLQIELVNSTAGAAFGVPNVGNAVLGVAQIADAGFDALTLTAGGIVPGNIFLDNSLALNLGRQLIFNSRSITVAGGIDAVLTAPYVRFGNPQTQNLAASAPVPTTGSGTLNVTARQIDLIGNFALQGVNSSTFTSLGDIQLQGTAAATGIETGVLLTSGSLALNSARLYPDTFTDFSIQSLQSGGTVSIGQTAASPGLPLSAGGAVNISADHIAIGGTLLAPFGSIGLTAQDSLTLVNGSLISVSGTGLDVPYGQTQLNGAQWIYQTAIGDTSIGGVPVKQVTLTAPNVTVQPSATIDLQGGGNLYAYEWVPGTGGHTDALLGTGASAGLYAIMPSAAGQAAPFDPQESGATPSTQTVYLSGGAGIAAGFYALLPARYALLPGADLVQIQSSYASATPGQIATLANGVPVVAGYLSSGSTGLHSGVTQYEGFAIYPGSYGQQLATYDISTASNFFGSAAAQAGTGAVPLPADAGTLTFSIIPALTNSFALQGSVLTAAAAGGRGAAVNISAPALEITAGSSGGAAGSIVVSAAVLQSWNASALTLGGSTTLDGSGVTVAANSVTVDEGVQLSADQILVVAQQSIDLKSGATLSSTSGKSGAPLAVLPTVQNLSLTDAGGSPLPQAALIAVSDVAVPVVTRTAANGAVGATVNLEAGSTLASGGALAIDAPGTISLAGTLSGKGASWSLSSSSVAFGPDSAGDSLNIGAGVLANLQQAGAVRIASTTSIDIFTPVSLGATSTGSAPTLTALSLLGGSLNNEASGDSIFGATNLFLGNPGAPAPALAGVSNGSLSFVADSLTLGPGNLAVSGFAHTVAQVAGAVQSVGAGGLSVSGDLTINAVEITPGMNSQTAINASGLLTIGAPTVLNAATKLPVLVGGSLNLSGDAIEDGGAIEAPSGLISLSATNGALHLASSASINVAGTLLQAVDQSAAAPGGTVALNSSGNLALDAGATINVSGEQIAPAGSLSVISGGAATLSATLLGNAGTTGTAGSFSLDAGQLTTGLSPVSALLSAGGFTNGIGIRVRSGDLDLSGSSTLNANQVVLTADTGAIDIAGGITAASGAQRGLIDLSSGTGVTLAATGQLHADAAGSAGRGGEIDINAICPTCSITLQAGSVVSAYGVAQMGEFVLRAPLLGASDVAINAGSQGLGADVSKAGQVVIEPVMVFQTSGATLNTDLAADVALAANYLTAAAPGIAARLGSASVPVAVQAGVELQDANAGDALTLQSFDFSQYSLQGQVINLNVRAAGAINVNGALSDGYVTDPNSGFIALTTLPSASLSLIAGADVASANPLSVLRGSAADLTLLTSSQPADGSTDGVGPSVVRTGTGNINLAASGNIVFGHGTSVYTAGIAAADPVEVLGFRGNEPIISFATGGGNVVLAAGTDLIGSVVNGDLGNYSVTGWQLRQGNAVNPAQYGANLAAFDWNVGALGGGDVSVRAAGNVTNLSAAAADSLVSAEDSATGVATLYGAGGGLNITAAGDIGSAQIFVANGVGTLTAGGGLTAVRTSPSGKPVGSSIAMDDSQVFVWARGNLQVDAIYNPTNVAQLQGSSSDVTGAYLTYGADSSVLLSSTAGAVTVDLTLVGDQMATLLGPSVLSAGQAGVVAQAAVVAPASLSLRSLQSDIVANVDGILFPSSTGQLEMFAGRDITASGILTISDSALGSYPTVTAPAVVPSSANGNVGGLLPFDGNIHVGDSSPALFTAGRDIIDLALSVPKAAQIVAGRDIVSLQYAGQHAGANDTTLISAGRDLIDTADGNNFPGIQVGGQGTVEVLAGRNMDLGFASGITTVGNLANANLPSSQGANLDVLVGYGTQGADLSGFLSQIITPSSTYQSQLVNYVESLTNTTTLTYAQAQSDFSTFSSAQQSALVDPVFFNELLLSGREANAGTGVGFTRGYAAIDALFPNSRSATATGADPYAGNLTLTSSQIYTLSGGDISIIVPGGAIDVGLANPPATLAAKPASSLGIVAQGNGNVNIYSQGDVNVNQSRIFTLGGGNILIWSDEGSIDAGNGSKSSLSVPPPLVLINANGTVSLDFAGSLASGSGIRTIQTNPGIAAGNVDLDAPVGTVDAGDAGIGSSGNINIAAAHVIGLDNIQFSGTSAGVPSDVSGLGASLSAVSAIASSAMTNATSVASNEANAAKEISPLAANALSWLDVFVTGLGEENCKPDDLECLKRQKTASP